MKSKKITAGDIRDMKISSLPTRPTAPAAFGGKGYTATELKEAFDKLPLFLTEKYNDLISDILCEDGESIADELRTGISDTHTLSELFEDIVNGNFAAYLEGPSGTVAESLIKLRQDVNKIAAKLNLNL